MKRVGTVKEQGGRTEQGEAKGGENQAQGAMFEATARVSAINIRILLQFQLSILLSVFFSPRMEGL